MLITTPLLAMVYGWEYFEDEARFIVGPADFWISWVLPAIVTVVCWLTQQATPGKMLIGARVVDAQTGGRITTGQAVGRYLAYFVSALPVGLGFLAAGADLRKQGWHDKLAGTVVLRRKPRAAEPVLFEA